MERSDLEAGGVSAASSSRLVRALGNTVLAIVALALPMLASAEGSRSLHPAGVTDAQSARGTMSVTSTNYFPGGVVRSRQFLYVYAQAGEYVLLGSRNRTADNTGPIRIFASAGGSGNFGNKGAETIPSNASAVFTCSGTGTLGNASGRGLIASRAAELAGPRAVDGSDGGDPARFEPCYYQVPTTGIYGVVFYGGLGTSGASIDTPAAGSNGVTAWDVTVRSSDTSSLTDLDGRVFTYAWGVGTGGNNTSSSLTSRAYRVSTQLYYVSTDGYRYRQQFHGVDPNVAAFYANSRGFLDTDGGPLYRDFRGGNHSVTGGRSSAVGIAAQRPEYPIFFSDASPTGPNAAEVNRVLTALSIPHAPLPPILTNPDFVGNIGGNTSVVSAGGIFTFDTVNTLTYEIVIKRGPVAAGADPNHPAGCLDNYDPANVCNRVLTGIALTGSHTVLWDGRDNNGHPFPADDYEFQVVGRNGEIHFPIADIEGNVNGGPTLTKLNGTNVGDTTVYFDDRGYRAANNALVGTLNGPLCGGAAGAGQPQPTPTYSLVGIDSAAHTGSGVSSLYYRRWGTTATSNPGSDCSSNSQFFGDSKGLDLWALEKSETFVRPVVIVEPSSEVDVGTMVSVTPVVLPGDSAFGTFVFTNAGSGTANGVSYSVNLGNPAVPATCPASVNFTLVPAGVTATYNPAPTCTITFSGMPTVLAPGQTLTFNFNYVVLPGNPGPIPVSTQINATNESPTQTAPNAANAQTVVARPVISVTKTAAPPAGTLVSPGQTITYTLSATIQNAPLTALFTLDDTPGPGLAFGAVDAGSTSTAFDCSGGLTCTLPAGTAMGTYTVTYTATVDTGATGSVANNVTATGGGGDNPPTCSPCTVTHPLPQPPNVFKAFSPDSIVAGGSSTLTITLANPNPATATLTANLVDSLPAGVTLATPLTISTTCSGGSGVSGTAGGSSITLASGAQIPAGSPGTCVITADVTGMTPGLFTNTIPAGGLQTDLGNNPGPAIADLAVGWDFCPAPGGTSPILSVMNGIDIWAYTPPGAGPDVLLPLTQAITGNLNGLMVDPVRNRLLSVQQAGGGSVVLWAYDAANGGWYAAAPAVPVSDFPRGGMTAAGIGYLVTGGSSPSVWRVEPDLGNPFAYTLSDIGTLTYSHAPTDAGSGDIAFDGNGDGWLVAGQDIYRVDIGAMTATRQTRPSGSPGYAWAGAAFGDDGRLYIANNAPAADSAYYAYDPVDGTLTLASDTVANGSRDLASCAFPVPAEPELQVVKSLYQVNGAVPSGPVLPGDVLTYAIHISNVGGAVATLYAGDVVETVPANSTHAGGDGFTCTPASGGSPCGNSADVNIPAGDSVTLYFSVQLTSPIIGTQIVNTVAIPGEVDCAVAPNACTVISPVGPAVTMSKTLQSGGPTAEAGETLVYDITLTNSTGTSMAIAAGAIGETVPANTTHAGGDSFNCVGAACTNTAAVTVPGNGSVVLTFAVIVDDPIPAGVTSIANTATPPPGVTCPTCSVDTPTAPNVTVNKVLTNENGSVVGVAEPGETLTYTITLSNEGGEDVTGYDLTDMLDANVVFVSADNGAVHDGSVLGGDVTWTALTIEGNGRPPLVLTVVVDVVDPLPAGVTQILNVAYATGTTPPQCPPSGAQCVLTPTPSQVTLVKALAAEGGNPDGVAEPGERLTYTITLTNEGGSDATGHGVTDQLDANTVFVSADNGGTHAAGVVTWAGLTVPAHDGVSPGTLVLTVEVDVVDPIPAGVAQIANLAYETGTTPPQCPPAGPANPQCVVTPSEGRVTISKALTGEDGSVPFIAEPGEQLTYTITLVNDGGSEVSAYGVTDPLDANVSFVSADNGGTHAAGVVTWTGLTVPANGSVVLTVVTEVVDPLPAGVTQIVNLAYQSGTTPPLCPPAGPAYPQCVLTPTPGSLSISKALSAESIDPDGVAAPGETLTYTITVLNHGGTAELNVVVNEWVPDNTVFVGGTPTWTCAPDDPPGTHCETLVDVPAHDGSTPGIATLTFTVRVDDPLAAGVTSLYNAVALGSNTPPNCVSQPAHPQCAVTPTVNMSLTKNVVSVSPTGPNTWRVVYSLVVTNTGGSPSLYTLNDTLEFTSDGVVFNGVAQVTSSDGVVNPALLGGTFLPVNGTSVQLSDALLTLPAGSSHTYQLTVPFAVVGPLATPLCTGVAGNGLFNRAAINGSIDVETAACAPVNGDTVRISLVKTVDLDSDHNGNNIAEAGDILRYDFVITNTGSVDLAPIQLLDPRVSSLQCQPLTAHGHPLHVLRGDELFGSSFEPRNLGSLITGDSMSCWATYTVTQGDVDNGRVSNTATTAGTSDGGQVATATATAIFTQFP